MGGTAPWSAAVHYKRPRGRPKLEMAGRDDRIRRPSTYGRRRCDGDAAAGSRGASTRPRCSLVFRSAPSLPIHRAAQPISRFNRNASVTGSNKTYDSKAYTESSQATKQALVLGYYLGVKALGTRLKAPVKG